MGELKPCAHCGNAEIKPLHECNSNRPLYRVKCYRCGMQTHLDDKDKVITAWNTRHEPDELPKWAIKEINTMKDWAMLNPEYGFGFGNACDRILSLRKPENK